MEHPLVGDISSLTIEQLQEKITSLVKKLSIAQRTGGGTLIPQIQMVLETYQNRYKFLLDEMYKSKSDEYQSKIDIS